MGIKNWRNDTGLKRRVCEAQGHTWYYERPFFQSSPWKGKIRRRCSCCHDVQIGSWRHTKKKGWEFIVLKEGRW